MIKTITKPRIVLLDIETSPITAYTWTTWNTNVIKILEPFQIISVSWKELGSDETFCRCQADYKGYKPGKLDDKALIKEVWDVLDKADVIIGHHSDSFDLKKLNARFLVHDLPAPSAYDTIDTKKVASRYFRFDSNSLDNLGTVLKVGNKINNGGFDLWVQCIAGNKDAWTKMKEYNIQDVLLLEKVYLKLRPFHKTHPDLNMLSGDFTELTKCSSCLSDKITKRGFAFTKTGKKQRYKCLDCGSWSLGIWKKTKDTDNNESTLCH